MSHLKAFVLLVVFTLSSKDPLMGTQVRNPSVDSVNWNLVEKTYRYLDNYGSVISMPLGLSTGLGGMSGEALTRSRRFWKVYWIRSWSDSCTCVFPVCLERASLQGAADPAALIKRGAFEEFLTSLQNQPAFSFLLLSVAHLASPA